ncbi:MAG: hypothetical protein AAFQ67_06815, partial [Pseudomonadota bacterium]
MSVSAALFTLAVASGLNLQPINDRCDQAAEAFGKADANGDGVITKAEVTELREDAFSRLDRNGDGYAEPADAPRRFRSRYEERFAPLRDQYDTDGDG